MTVRVTTSGVKVKRPKGWRARETNPVVVELLVAYDCTSEAEVEILAEWLHKVNDQAWEKHYELDRLEHALMKQAHSDGNGDGDGSDFSP